MIEVVVLLSVLFLIWIIWQYLNARQYNQFLRWLLSDIKPQVIEAIKSDLAESSSALRPNTQAHIDACIYHWTSHKVRIAQAALKYELLSEDWLTTPQNKRNMQHLFHVEGAYKIVN